MRFELVAVASTIVTHSNPDHSFAWKDPYLTHHSDLTFITNENGQNLLNRFKVLIKDTEFFDVLVGYFYTSGFRALYKSLGKTRKIRILIGISTNLS